MFGQCGSIYVTIESQDLDPIPGLRLTTRPKPPTATWVVILAQYSVSVRSSAAT